MRIAGAERKAIDANIKDVLDRQVFSPYYVNPKGGKYVQELERQFATYHGRKHAIAVSSGTAALHIALESLWLPKGSVVLTSPYTFLASATSILMAGHIPMFSDIDPYDFCINAWVKPEEKVPENLAAVIPVHLFGYPAAYRQFLRNRVFAVDPYEDEDELYLNIPVIEDCAQSLGAKRDGVLTGKEGTLACFSFQETKTIMSGEGGMILTDDDELEYRCRALRSHGSQYVGYPRLSWNYRMTELQAAVGVAEFETLDQKLTLQRDNAKKIIQDLPRDLKHFVEPELAHSYFILALYASDSKRRDRFISLLPKWQPKPGKTISAGYQELLYDKPVLKEYAPTWDCPMAREVMKHSIWLDIHRFRDWWEVEKDWEMIKELWEKA